MVLLVMVRVVGVLRKLDSPPKEVILTETGRIRGFIHISVNTQHPPWSYLVVIIFRS